MNYSEGICCAPLCLQEGKGDRHIITQQSLRCKFDPFEAHAAEENAEGVPT